MILLCTAAHVAWKKASSLADLLNWSSPDQNRTKQDQRGQDSSSRFSEGAMSEGNPIWKQELTHLPTEGSLALRSLGHDKCVIT